MHVEDKDSLAVILPDYVFLFFCSCLLNDGWEGEP